MTEWAVITGGGRGIGAQLSLLLAEQGLHVLVVDINTEPVRHILESHKHKERVHLLQADLTIPETAEQISSFIPKEDSIKFLIPSQRIGNIAKLENLNICDFELSMKVHVMSPLMVAQALIPRMKKAKSRILHTDTLIDFYPEYGCGAYGISKTAYHKLGKQFKLELTDTLIRVGSAYPGHVNTEGFHDDHKALKDHKLLSEQGINLIENNRKNGTFLEPDVSAQFLRFVLMDTSDEEFENNDWRANDKSMWGRWKK